MCICIIYTHTYICIYIYICIHREREREREIARQRVLSILRHVQVGDVIIWHAQGTHATPELVPGVPKQAGNLLGTASVYVPKPVTNHQLRMSCRIGIVSGSLGILRWDGGGLTARKDGGNDSGLPQTTHSGVQGCGV